MVPLLTSLVAANLAAWVAALWLFHAQPALLGMAFVAYAYGLRHGVDADHIAAIDNVIRNLMHRGQRPMAAGLCFSLGHAGIVIALSAAVAATAGTLHGMDVLKGIGDGLGTSISAVFLLAIAAVNLRQLRTCRRASRRWPLALITRSWQMLPLGMLFGLGFDTASEVGLLGISAIQGAHGLSPWAIMIFPILFAVAMALVDTLDSALMLGTYGWAEGGHRYTRVLTGLSAAAAIAVAIMEISRMLGADAMADPGMLGLMIIALFAAIWVVSVVRQRWRPA